ncbi:hypothetical protein FB45DRAFT_871998 [Roridomyces roridus]|uniref:Uncharacterized protein n=1 Tax=Roridomyces roridus TaxID=1738132 RepID=A0AAD7FE41_9AGAR|nr:hypothetical protein FB45DRAFT_871998 [Roridomyces roridus]
MYFWETKDSPCKDKPGGSKQAAYWQEPGVPYELPQISITTTAEVVQLDRGVIEFQPKSSRAGESTSATCSFEEQVGRFYPTRHDEECNIGMEDEPRGHEGSACDCVLKRKRFPGCTRLSAVNMMCSESEVQQPQNQGRGTAGIQGPWSDHGREGEERMWLVSRHNHEDNTPPPGASTRPNILVAARPLGYFANERELNADTLLSDFLGGRKKSLSVGIGGRILDSENQCVGARSYGMRFRVNSLRNTTDTVTDRDADAKRF